LANTGPRTRVEAPPATSPRYGLLASIPVTKNVDPRWTTGISYKPEGCQEGQTFDICDPDTRNDPTSPDVVEWDPYAISVADVCSTFSGVDENNARVLRLLNADTERQLGAELWDGAVAQSGSLENNWLAVGSNSHGWTFTDLTGASPAGYLESVSCLEQYLAENNSGQQGVIHATAQVVTAWESFRLVRKVGNEVLTFQDNLVIASPGYSGSGPDGMGIWAYATDMPRIFLDAVQTFPAMDSIDRSDNTVTVVAQRIALVEWQKCRHAGIEIDIDPCGGGS
jgi:hypothetical protein